MGSRELFQKFERITPITFDKQNEHHFNGSSTDSNSWILQNVFRRRVILVPQD